MLVRKKPKETATLLLKTEHTTLNDIPPFQKPRIRVCPYNYVSLGGQPGRPAGPLCDRPGLYMASWAYNCLTIWVASFRSGNTCFVQLLIVRHSFGAIWCTSI